MQDGLFNDTPLIHNVGIIVYQMKNRYKTQKFKYFLKNLWGMRKTASKANNYVL